MTTQSTAGVPANEDDGIIPRTSETYEGNLGLQQSLSRALYSRRSEYTQKRKLRVKIGTWNIGGHKETENDLAAWFLEDDASSAKIGTHSGEQHPDEASEIGLYALGLQELVNISSASEALRPYTDPEPANKIKRALEYALPSGYRQIAQEQLFGMVLFIFASPAIAPHVSYVRKTTVGTGLMGYMGNKGAVCVQVVLGETSRVLFINSHMSAGNDQSAVDRRNWDASTILNRTKFEAWNPPNCPSSELLTQHEHIGSEDFAFWFGDLNYRLSSIPGEDVRKLLERHIQPSENESNGTSHDESLTMNSNTSSSRDVASNSPSMPSSVASLRDDANDPDDYPRERRDTVFTLDGLDPSDDPASLQTTISCLLAHDELAEQQKKRKAFHEGWSEGKITFLPSYKYDLGKTDTFDSSEKKRPPSWTDRILFRTKRRYETYLQQKVNAKDSSKRDAELKKEGVEQAAADEAALFDYNPDTDADYNYDEEGMDASRDSLQNSAGDEYEALNILRYDTHTEIVSSDHKPVEAIFEIEYDAVVPFLRSKLRQEITRDIDQHENETRPSLSLVVEGSDDETIDFGAISFGRSSLRSLILANTGQVPTRMSFVDQLGQSGTMSRQRSQLSPNQWLTIRAQDQNGEKVLVRNEEFSLTPGDSLNLDIVAQVTDMETVRQLSQGSSHMSETLILRIENGRDHFIPMQAEWKVTVFGCPIDILTRIPATESIRTFAQYGTKSVQQLPIQCSAPRELFRLTEALDKQVEALLKDQRVSDDNYVRYESGTWPFGIQHPHPDTDSEGMKRNILEALDTSKPFEDFENSPLAVEILGAILFTFVNSFQDGIVTKTLWKEIQDSVLARNKAKVRATREDERNAVIDVMASEPRYNVAFVLLTDCLARLVNYLVTLDDGKGDGSKVDSKDETHEQNTKRRSRAIAEHFADSVIRSGEITKVKGRKTDFDRKASLLEIFIGSK